jgi:hypothetical protein
MPQPTARQIAQSGAVLIHKILLHYGGHYSAADNGLAHHRGKVSG